MKNNEQAKVQHNAMQENTVGAKPLPSFPARQLSSDRRHPDPSSVLRSDRYPIPDSFEYRMQTR